MPLQVQAKILRVLETKIFERIGSVQTQEATFALWVLPQRRPAGGRAQKRFREDRSSGFRWYRFPPLRERHADLRLLARHFLQPVLREFKKEDLVLSESALKLVESYRWPGNVREFETYRESRDHV